jgi:hypothetical protein
VIRQGSGADMIAAIRESPRALTFISVPWSGPERAAREVFRNAVAQLEETDPLSNVGFFMLEVDEDEASRTWLTSIGLAQFVSAGYGSVIWSERGRVVSSAITANALGADGIVDRTTSLW